MVGNLQRRKMFLFLLNVDLQQKVVNKLFIKWSLVNQLIFALCRIPASSSLLCLRPFKAVFKPALMKMLGS